MVPLDPNYGSVWRRAVAPARVSGVILCNHKTKVVFPVCPLFDSSDSHKNLLLLLLLGSINTQSTHFLLKYIQIKAKTGLNNPDELN